MPSIDRAKYMDQAEVARLRTVTEAQAISDLAAARVRGPLAWAVVDVALSTGLRVSEIARLTIGDIQYKVGNGGALRVWRHKRRQRIQETLAISRELASHLEAYIAFRRTLGQPEQSDDSLFWGERGPLTTRGLQQIWHRAVSRAGLPAGLSIHSARHTLAVALLKRTGNLRQVQKQLGHTSPVVTANMYADVSFDDMQAGVNGLYEDRHG